MSTHSAARLLLTLSLAASLVLLIVSPTPSAAQDVASITGVVTDSSGAVVPDTQVTLRNPQTGDTYRGTTNSTGSYTINQVKPGPGYEISFKHEGFNPLVLFGLYLNVNATRTQNATLNVGAGKETVEVSASSETVTLNTTDATVGNNLQVQVMEDLPIQDRSSPSALFIAQPGVTLDGAVTGARVDQSRVTLDGLDVNDMGTGYFGSIVGTAPVDSVQEFRGVSAGYVSENAGGGGGQFELVTKSGTNTFHGSLVEFHRDTAMEANDWFNNNFGVPRPPLIRNQFGGNIGGPILKDKLFFFFDYNGHRDRRSSLVERTVPLDSFRAGNIQYINSNGDVETLPATAVSGQSVQSLDPLGLGMNTSLQTLFNDRYPHANDLSGAVGDGLNTGGFRFNAPIPVKEDDFVQRVDYNLNSKMKLYGRGSFTRYNRTYSSEWFPGDPLTAPFFDKSYSWVVGHTWTISNTMVNQFSYGKVLEDFDFPIIYNPTGATQFQAMGGTGTGSYILDAPYRSAINAQGRTYPIPVIRDDFSWDRGQHSFKFGGTFKNISPHDHTILNYNVPTVGLGGYMGSLDDTLRPSDICIQDPCSFAPGLYDAAFALALAPYTNMGSTFNYDAQGNVLPQGSGSKHNYRYYETELYFGDTWKVVPKLTMSYGLRWVNYSVPYDTKGIESVQNFDFDTYFASRVAQSAASQFGDSAVPLIAYSLGGKANHAPGYFKPQYKNFGPRLAFAYAANPKTVFNAGAGILFDQTVINAVQYQQSQYSYLFQAGVTEQYGTPSDASTMLSQFSRFAGLDSPPPTPTAPTITKPFYPYVDETGVPFGLANGQAFNEIIDPKLKTPYYIQLNFGFQKEIPHGFILKAEYVGRLGRRLLAQADANQLIDFKDPGSGQMMGAAFAGVTQELRAGVAPSAVTAQPWYEDILPQLSATRSNTAVLARSFLGTYIGRGDFADFTEYLSAFGLLPSNVGMASQFSENTFYTNKGNSNYHGLLTTLHKNAGHGLQFDFNYTWSHSIDNVSIVANQAAFGGYGFVCDVLRPRECRGNSDFDVAHYFNGNFLYDLPFGRGRALAGDAPHWLNEVIGGWSISGIPSWHSGNAYATQSLAFVAGYANDAPAIRVGPAADMNSHLNGGHGQALYGFRNPSQANNDYVGPIGFDIGARNDLRGPLFFNLDMGLAKSFPIYAEKVALKFRADAFNVLNHPNFSTPCVDITNLTCQFGQISTTEGTTINNSGPTSRVLQLALRLEF